METLTTDNDIKNALHESITLIKNDDELVKVLDCTIAQRGDDYLRDQGLIRHSTRRILQLKKDLEVTNTFLNKFLDEFEGKWDSNETCDSPAIALDYLAAAKHAEKFGRTNNRINQVQAWYDSADSLPFPKA